MLPVLLAVAAALAPQPGSHVERHYGVDLLMPPKSVPCGDIVLGVRFTKHARSRGLRGYGTSPRGFVVAETNYWLKTEQGAGHWRYRRLQAGGHCGSTMK